MKKLINWFKKRENKYMLLALSPLILIGGTTLFIFAAKAGILWWTIKFTAGFCVGAYLFNRWCSWCLKKAFPDFFDDNKSNKDSIPGH